MDIDVIDTLRQPEYTGEDRCEPCTVLNVAIAAILGSAVARKSKLGGIACFGLSIGLIYLRGYLVPGTPTLTKRYLPSEVLRWFGKDPEPELATGFADIESGSTPAPEQRTPENTADQVEEKVQTNTDETADGSDTQTDVSSDTDSQAVEQVTDDQEVVEPSGKSTATTESSGDDTEVLEPSGDDLESFFMTHGVLEPCAESDDLCLTERFETAWLDEVASLDETAITGDVVTEAFGIDTEDEEYEISARDDVRVLESSSHPVSKWPSEAALLADIAACRVLRSTVPGWSEYDIGTKGQVLNSLRMFFETCPTTGGEVQMGEEVVESCCSSHSVIAVTCEETGERLFEHPLDAVEQNS